MENPFTPQEANPKPNTLLKVLCILTFIGSGVLALGYGLTSLLFNQVLQEMYNVESSMGGVLGDAYSNTVDIMEKGGWGYFAISALLALASLAGAILMYTQKRIGFHFYTSAQLLMLFVGAIFGFGWPGFMGILWTCLWITLYARAVFRPIPKA